ncbi:MAG TPA: hypothetical protein VFQ65_02285 [Kofleriaceae bacterium]|nr:hypothetical protein [Kofleriaceae bacterium]
MTSWMVLLTLLGGCFIMPKNRVEVAVAARPEPLDVQVLGPVELHVDVVGHTALVTATAPRLCIARKRQIATTHRYVGAELDTIGGGGAGTGSGYGILILGGVMAVTGAVSGLITLTAVAIDHGGTTEHTESVVEVRRFACPAKVPSVSVAVTFADGRVTRGITNAGGVFGAWIHDGVDTSGIVAALAP